MLIDDLQAAIAKVCPIIGVRIGNPDNRSSWEIEFTSEATTEQREAAQRVLNDFVPTDDSQLTAAAKISAGLTISSNTTPALNGCYAIDQSAQDAITAVTVYLLVNNRFPAGQSELMWPDIGGTPHAFPTPASFLAFATAVADYVATLDLTAKQSNPTWPTNAVVLP